MILIWWKKRKQRKAKSRFNSGFDYAVGALLRGDQTEAELEIQADNPFDYDDFERGMLAGMHLLRTQYVLRRPLGEGPLDSLVAQIEQDVKTAIGWADPN